MMPIASTVDTSPTGHLGEGISNIGGTVVLATASTGLGSLNVGGRLVVDA